MLPMLSTPTAPAQVVVPFWWGKHSCDAAGLFSCKNKGKCQNFGMGTTMPPTYCPMVGDAHFSCAARLYPWLVEQFGPNVHASDRPTRPRPALVEASLTPQKLHLL